jgi:hypothetical protein
MKSRFETILISLVIGLFATSTPLYAGDKNGTWTHSYKFYRNHFKFLSTSEVNYCERLLKEILNNLDMENQCNEDNDCVLIDQDPFGATVHLSPARHPRS